MERRRLKRSGSMNSYVAGLRRMPAWWMPAWVAKALEPKIALLRGISILITPHSVWYAPNSSPLRTLVVAFGAGLLNSSTAISSSSEVFPARSRTACAARILDRGAGLPDRQQAGRRDGWLAGCCSRSSTC